MAGSSQQIGSSRAFVCPHCEQPAVGHIRGLANWGGWAKNRARPIALPAEFALLQCGICTEVSLQLREDYGRGFDADDSPIIIYPAQRRLSHAVPDALRREFEEAQACFRTKAYKATVVMVRRVLEGTCRESDVQENTLVKSLQKLKAEGLIDVTIAEWADALRVLGNEGAHYTGTQVPRDDAEDALAFAETLLDHIYVLRKRFEEFANRRANRSTLP